MQQPEGPLQLGLLLPHIVPQPGAHVFPARVDAQQPSPLLFLVEGTGADPACRSLAGPGPASPRHALSPGSSLVPHSWPVPRLVPGPAGAAAPFRWLLSVTEFPPPPPTPVGADALSVSHLVDHSVSPKVRTTATTTGQALSSSLSPTPSPTPFPSLTPRHLFPVPSPVPSSSPIPSGLLPLPPPRTVPAPPTLKSIVAENSPRRPPRDWLRES